MTDRATEIPRKILAGWDGPTTAFLTTVRCRFYGQLPGDIIS